MSRDPAEGPTADIAYTFSFADFFAVRRAVAWNGVFGPATYWIRAAIPAVVVPVCWAVPIMTELKARGFDHWQMLTVVAVLAGGIALFIAILALDLLVGRLTFGRLALANSTISLRLESDGVHYRTPSDTGILSWSGIRRVAMQPGYLLLCISKSEAMTLPRRAFASDSAFGDTARYVLARTGVGAAR